MGDAVVYLVPVGPDRFELYSEAPDDTGGSPSARDAFWRRQGRRVHERWREAVHAARGTQPTAGRIARARDWAVRRTAESIAEQRTLWSLRGVSSASLVYPSDLSDASAAAARDRLLTDARRHHARWLILDAGLLAMTALLVLLPGPNIIGYYFAFRFVGHCFSWRGARQALDRTTWRVSAEPALSELGRLAQLPRETRAARVHAIATGLKLQRLAAFFDRTAVPAR
jgi:hypothetical protein